MPSVMPGAGDLHLFLVAAGLRTGTFTDADKALDLRGAVGAAKSDFESAMKYEPFLAAAADVTVPFSPTDVLYLPNEMPMLDLDGGFTSVTSVKVGVTPDNPTGDTLTVNEDYFLRPARAASKGKPYTWIEFYNGLSTITLAGATNYPDSIRVAGKRGYSLTVPDWAFQAVTSRAAKRVMGRVATMIAGGATSMQLGDDAWKYDPKVYEFVMKTADDDWKEAMRHRRIPIK